LTLLVDLLARTDFMEKAGTGIKRITNACVDNGNKVHFEFSDSFWLTIHSNHEYPDKVPDRVGEKVGEKVGENLTENQQKIILIIKRNNNISAQKMAEEIGISQRKVEENIAKLKFFGLLKRISPAKGGHWQIIDQQKD
jgi:ATP-dependent DNA helicase RecG